MRRALHEVGGLWTLVLIVTVTLVLLVLLAGARHAGGSGGISTKPLLGQLIPSPNRDHIREDGALLIIPGQPPVGGPHFATPQVPGFYEAPVPDGNIIHSLEHGVVWISYNPALVDAEGVRALRKIWDRYQNDVIVSPRPANSMTVALAS